MSDFWFYLGATVSMIATTFMVGFAVKKKYFATLGATVAPFATFLWFCSAILCANAYSDFKNKLLRDEREAYIKQHKEYGDAVITGINTSLQHQGQALLIMNDNLLKLQNTVIYGRKQDLKEIEFTDEPQKQKE